MARLLVALILLAFPIVELYTLLHVGHTVGWWLVAWLVLTFFFGLALIREAGAALLFELIGNFVTPGARLAIPVRSHWTLLAGFLLLFPGLLSDLIALLLLIFGREELPRFRTARAGGVVIEGQYRRER